MEGALVTKKRKFMFLYLKTGNGHISNSKVLKEAVEKLDPNIECMLVNGFDKKNYMMRLFFEKGYSSSTNYIHGLFPLMYDIGSHRSFLKIFVAFLQQHTARYLQKVMEENDITDVVSVHFALTPAVRQAIRRMKRPDINLTVLCTDPFTPPLSWFYSQHEDTLVFSEDAKNMAVNKWKMPENLVKVAPFLINEKFLRERSEEERLSLRKKFDFPEDKRVALLVGGGEGLPGALKFINQCIIYKAKFSIAVICGRNEGLAKQLKIYKKLNPQLDIHIFGFVNNMDELITASDLVITKAGPATLMEIMLLKKPMIINSYIHNQELGNMRFIVKNKVGFYIRHSKQIFEKVNDIFSSDEKYNETLKHCHALKIDTDSSKVARYLLDK